MQNHSDTPLIPMYFELHDDQWSAHSVVLGYTGAGTTPGEALTDLAQHPDFNTAFIAWVDDREQRAIRDAAILADLPNH